MTPKLSSCKSSLNPPQAKFNNVRVIGQVSSAPLWGRRNRARCLTLRASVSDGGLSSSQDGSSAVEYEKEEKGLILGTEKDDSGAVIGFHLIPPSGTCLYIVE